MKTRPALVWGLLVVGWVTTCGRVWADVGLPAIFSHHMVLQRDQANPVWGWADPGEAITLIIAGQTHRTTAGDDGRWRIELDPLPAGGPHRMVIEGKNRLVVEDILVGEVWICSGQSNMEWPVRAASNPDLEHLTAKYPAIRFITVPHTGTQTPQEDFDGQWVVCSPETIDDFSAVGYFFGRQIHKTLDVPVGLIDNSWGGSSAEAWVRRDLLEANMEQYGPLLARWAELESRPDLAEPMAEFEKKLAEWNERLRKARQQQTAAPSRPNPPRSQLANQHRPGNLYNGCLRPILGYGIRGVIWYQGESNAARAYQYRHLFPLLIQSWRDEWKQGDFAFYWVQLADFMAEKAEPTESEWAELREAQTMTLALPHTGQAVIIDLGEGNDIHPKNKLEVGKRLARLALAQDYHIPVASRSPQMQSYERQGNKIVITFDHVDRGLVTRDTNEVRGFAIAGEDRKFVWAQAKIVGQGRNQVEVWSDQVAEPVAVRYAWADNPVCNLYSAAGLPVTPFRTDDWPGVTAEAK
ncbi:MAG: 9-O-acetylesterase [Pirellulaceae bacterium]|nr:MAG: 9-O-acetylesterase [Pirellulaceae bacterium]